MQIVDMSVCLYFIATCRTIRSIPWKKGTSLRAGSLIRPVEQRLFSKACAWLGSEGKQDAPAELTAGQEMARCLPTCTIQGCPFVQVYSGQTEERPISRIVEIPDPSTLRKVFNSERHLLPKKGWWV